jgi:hypothetical protein
MSEIKTKPPSKEYESGWDRIWQTKEVQQKEDHAIENVNPKETHVSNAIEQSKK